MAVDIDRAFREHAAPVLARVARRVNAPHATLEDACQFAWTQAWRNRDRLRDEPDLLRAWLVKVAEREAWRLMRAPQAGISEDVATMERTARDELADRDARIEALALVGQVSAQQARVLVLWSAGYSYDEIAEHLGISYTAVNKALTRARTRLRGERRKR